jgi:hypothetical protein
MCRSQEITHIVFVDITRAGHKLRLPADYVGQQVSQLTCRTMCHMLAVRCRRSTGQKQLIVVRMCRQYTCYLQCWPRDSQAYSVGATHFEILLITYKPIHRTDDRFTTGIYECSQMPMEAWENHAIVSSIK